MKRATLIRQMSGKLGTFGLITTGLQQWFTIERPWEDNQNNVSCIPIGTYKCIWSLSPRLKKFTYEITGVPKRSGIRIHSANFTSQVLGCVALGEKRGTMDGKPAILLSTSAVRLFNSTFNKEPFLLEIR
jgi:hypothetical protein